MTLHEIGSSLRKVVVNIISVGSSAIARRGRRVATSTGELRRHQLRRRRVSPPR